MNTHDESPLSLVRRIYETTSRQPFIEALMHRFVLVPEGRMDAEWFKLLSLIAITDQELGSCAEPVPFGTVFGIVPTHDACVVETIERIGDIRSGVVALVDGDGAGDGYLKCLLKAACPPQHVVHWPVGWEIEDVIGWVLGDEENLVPLIQADMPAAPATIAEIVTWIKTRPNEKGAKADILAYEAITAALLTSSSAKLRVRTLLAALVDLTSEKPSSQLLLADHTLTTATTAVWRIVLEP